MLRNFWKDEDGQALTEYGLVLGIVALAAIAILVGLKDKIVALFTKITEALGEI